MKTSYAMAIAALCVWSGAAGAQVAPTPAERAAYVGFHAAAAKGEAAEIARLAATSAFVAGRDARGRTPYLVAAHAGQRAAMQALVAAGANPRALDDDRYDAITIAAVRDDEATMDTAIQLGGDPRAITSPYEGTALIAAAHLGHDGVVRRLIAAGAPLDHVNNLGWTALIEAVILGDGGPRHVACVKALTQAGANTKRADRSGAAPLQLAQARGYGAMVEILRAAR